MSTMVVFLIFVPILAGILLQTNILLGPSNPYSAKSAVFECGFSSFLAQTRTPFSVSFFVFGQKWGLGPFTLAYKYQTPGNP